MLCWKCHEPLRPGGPGRDGGSEGSVTGPLCVGCGALQPLPPDPDLFAVLGLPRRHALEEPVLEAAVRERSRLVHPDRHVRAGAVERRLALQWTARVNEARRVLKDPRARARYLVFGRADAEKVPPPSDPQFLQTVFGWRMGAETGDPAVRDQVEQVRRDLLDGLSRVFEAWERGEGDLEPARDLLSRLRFVENVAAELE